MSDEWRELARDPDPWRPPKTLPGEVVTERCIVRLYRRGDGAALHAAVASSRDALLPWMLWATTDHLEVDDSVHYVETMRRGYTRPDQTNFPMGIFDRTTGKLVGGTGFHRIDPNQRCAEIGYWVAGPTQGKGVCTEAVGSLITSALRPQVRGGWGFRRVVVYADMANRGSIRVCEKLGLRHEARMRAERYHGYPEGRYTDTSMFAILAGEWDESTHRAKPGVGW